MKRQTFILFSFFLCLGLPGAASAAGVVETDWLVQLKPGISGEEAHRQLSDTLGREIRQKRRFQHVLNGFVTTLTTHEADELRGHVNVHRVVADERLELLITSQTPQTPVKLALRQSTAIKNARDNVTSGDPVVDLIRANELWDGSATDDEGHLGEGVVIGVTGTGISGDHPSFAATGGDGYTHINPLGDGVYLGECFDGPGLACNSKLIGRYTFSNDAQLNSEEPDGASNRAAGLSAGNRLVDDAVSALGVPIVTGVAPHANLIVYRTCETTCATSNVLSAFEQAIIDNVDVLVHFISSPTTTPWNSIYESASLALHANGTSLAYVTGNGGPEPGTLAVGLAAPWVATFIPSTHARSTELKVLTNFSGGDSPPPGDLVGGSYGGIIAANIVYAGALGVPVDSAELCLEPFPQGTLNGEILVCDRGEISRVQKAINAATSGAGGFVLANVAGGIDSVNSDVFPLPGIHLNAADSEVLREWLSSGTNHAAAIVLNNDSSDPDLADRLSAQSSRGPLLGLDYLVPSATVPAISVLSPDGANGFQVVTGPAAAPGAGAIALLKSARPAWTDAEILSALMTTGVAPLVEQFDDEVTTAFDHGGGRIDLAAAVQAGLVLNETVAGFTGANPDEGGAPSSMNLPGLIELNCQQECQWTRTVKAVRASTWTAVVDGSATGAEIDVAPENFSLEPGQEQEIQVTFSLVDGADGDYHADVILVPDVAGVSPTRFSLRVSVTGDADLDGVANAQDNCLVVANEMQRDSDGDGFGNRCDTDLNNDGITNFVDASEFSQHFQTADQTADFDGDGTVDFIDLQILQDYFLKAPGPSGLF